MADEPTMPESDFDPSKYPESGVRWTTVGAGAALTVGWYGVGYGVSELWSDAPGADDLKMPVIGPWQALGQSGCSESEGSDCIFMPVLRGVFHVLSGIGQAGGILVMLEGAFLPSAPAEAATIAGGTRSSTADPSSDSAAASFSIAPSAVVTDHGVSLGLIGAF